ncbi:hypothetical protein KSP35_13130 [Aquihabitans sp. G128]|uniref:hypothetical protein n=1 Tax=Aquihabitans sp. G128 TaxID=2849779 RepID=UPI001C22B963|nr:hypothetical protein [Aquihabitans sp. G128]QXC59346.1 hypothetical protein KSP35_13130 [Aquihabitans sp. G128]
MDDLSTAESVLTLMGEWVAGRRSWINLGPDAPYTPDVIAAMDAAEVEKLRHLHAALAASPAPADEGREGSGKRLVPDHPAYKPGGPLFGMHTDGHMTDDDYAPPRPAAAPPAAAVPEERDEVLPCGHKPSEIIVPIMPITSSLWWCRPGSHYTSVDPAAARPAPEPAAPTEEEAP